MRVASWMIALFLPLLAAAQAPDSPAAMQKAVVAKYHVTQATADHTDIVTAGDVITLQKSGLVMYGLSNVMANSGNVSYHDGKLAAGGMTKFMGLGSLHATDQTRSRTFVAGEKVWLVDVSVKDDGLYLRFLSDAINDIRYMGAIKFPFDKKQGPLPVDTVMKSVAEVIGAAPSDDAGKDSRGGQAPAAAAPAAPAPAPMADIAPPPPPPDQPAAPPPTISLGEKRDAVIAAFGEPTKTTKLGTKEIDFFKDMKVTFVNGKVTDVQ